MNCKKCGYELKENWNICPKCAEIINKENIDYYTINKKDESLPNYEGKDKTCLIIFLISVAGSFFLEKLSGICFIIALIAIVDGYIKYPQNKAIKVFFWIFAILIILAILSVILLVFTCSAPIVSTITRYRCP